VTTCHLVTWLQATLDRKVNLDHLKYAGWQFVTLRELFTLFFKSKIKLMALLFKRLFGLHKHYCVRFVSQANIKPLPTIELNQIFFGQSRAFSKLAWSTIDDLFDQQLFDTIESVVFNDTQLVIQVLAVATQFIINDGLRALVAHNAFARKDLNVNDCANHA